MEEVWKDIPGFEGRYQVSNLGRIKSLDYKARAKNGNFTRPVKGRILKQGWNGFYFHVRLGATKTQLVHRIVATVFCKNPDKKPCVDHLDSDPKNNHCKNLEWVTSKENNQRIFKRGSIGSARPASKLTEKDVRHIRSEYFYNDQNPKIKEKLSKGYGVHIATIGRIVNYYGWNHV